MRLPVLTCTVALASIVAGTARGAYLSELPYDYSRRDIANYYNTPPFSQPTASLTGKAGGLATGSDGRYNDYFDAGIKFALPAASNILSASLTFTVAGTQATPGGGTANTTLQVSGKGAAAGALSLSDFGAATANVGTISLPENLFTGSITPISFVYDVTSLILGLSSSRSSSVLFQFDDFVRGTAFNISSPYLGADANSPYLTIVYAPAAVTPEPSSLALVAVGVMAAVAGRSARRRRAV